MASDLFTYGAPVVGVIVSALIAYGYNLGKSQQQPAAPANPTPQPREPRDLGHIEDRLDKHDSDIEDLRAQMHKLDKDFAVGISKITTELKLKREQRERGAPNGAGRRFDDDDDRESS